MNQNPKDLHAAQILIEELRAKGRYQTEHIMKWKKAYAIQIQQHYRYQKEKNDQMNTLTSQLLLLESRLRRTQKQIAGIICQREITIARQQRIIEALSSKLVEHGLETITPPNFDEFDLLNDSDSAVVLEDIDSDCNSSFLMRRRNNGCDVTVVRSISDAMDNNVNKYCGVRRTNCFLRRPDILETVYSVEEDTEPQSIDLTEKRDKFKNRSLNAVHVSSIENAIENNDHGSVVVNIVELSKEIPISVENKTSQIFNYNRIMSNHRAVTKPRDVKYKRINKAKSKSLEELRGRLKHWVEKGNVLDAGTIVGETIPKTTQSFA